MVAALGKWAEVFPEPAIRLSTTLLVAVARDCEITNGYLGRPPPSRLRAQWAMMESA